VSESTGQGPDLQEPSGLPVVPWDAARESPAEPGVGLWSPRDVGWASALLGYPGAVVLAALNWRRTDRTRKAVVHLAAALLSSWVLVYLGLGPLWLVLDIAIGYYLFRALKVDQTPAAIGRAVARRSGLAGALLALAGTIVVVGSGAFVAAAVEIATVTHRGEILFSTNAATDACTAIGPASSFGPTDPIYLVAVLRETVKAGSHAVYEIDGPGLHVGPLPVPVEPPFDCIRTTSSLGPLDPGTYAVRYGYDGQPASQDLATGTFTVTAGPGSSGASPSTAAAGASASSSPSTSSPSPAQASSSAAASSGAACADPAEVARSHQAPEIEAILPATVQGRQLTRWSVRGRCWLQLAFGTSSQMDTFVAMFKTPTNPDPVDDTRLVYGVAGRSDTSTDPPYFVFAAVRPEDDDETGLALALVFGLAGFRDVAGATDLTHYKETTIAGKDVFLGTADMVDQDSHQRGKPYLYQDDRHMFVVITDDDAWAAEAIGKLP
jgi:hypothetical protein